MVEARGEGDPSTGVVRYSTAVRPPSRTFPGAEKRRIWRSRQIQNQAYIWSVLQDAAAPSPVFWSQQAGQAGAFDVTATELFDGAMGAKTGTGVAEGVVPRHGAGPEQRVDVKRRVVSVQSLALVGRRSRG